MRFLVEVEEAGAGLEKTVVEGTPFVVVGVPDRVVVCDDGAKAEKYLTCFE